MKKLQTLPRLQSHIRNQPCCQSTSKRLGQLGDQLLNQLDDQLWDQLHDQLSSKLRVQLHQQLGLVVKIDNEKIDYFDLKCKR